MVASWLCHAFCGCAMRCPSSAGICKRLASPRPAAQCWTEHGFMQPPACLLACFVHPGWVPATPASAHLPCRASPAEWNQWSPSSAWQACANNRANAHLCCHAVGSHACSSLCNAAASAGREGWGAANELYSGLCASVITVPDFPTSFAITRFSKTIQFFPDVWAVTYGPNAVANSDPYWWVPQLEAVLRMEPAGCRCVFARPRLLVQSCNADLPMEPADISPTTSSAASLPCACSKYNDQKLQASCSAGVPCRRHGTRDLPHSHACTTRQGLQLRLPPPGFPPPGTSN